MQELLIQSLEIDWNEIDARDYLRSIHAVQALKRLAFHSPVTFFAGENGSGKSTLLEAIAVAYGFNPEGGTKNYSFSTYDSHSRLAEALRLVRGVRRADWGYFLRAESFYNVATQEESYADPGHPSERYHQKSHGESFLALAQQEFRPQGLYLLDEPEAALSPQRQMSLLVEIARCAAQGSQFIIASHSPILLAMPEAEILCFDADGVRPCTYEETDSYRITKMFLDDRKRILHHLLGGIE